jgi:Na+-driven multidrug efflux pump
VPHAWVGLFSADPAVLESGSRYLSTVAPFYPMLAANIALYFASQGAGKVLWPVLAGTARLGIVVTGGALAASLAGIFAAIAVAMAVSGLLTIWFVARTEWK